MLSIVNREYGDVVKFLQDGTKETIIRAKKKDGYLKFPKPSSRKSPYKKIPGNIAFEKDGNIFAKAVRHPGIEARKFITKVLDDPSNLKVFEQTLEKEIEKVLA